jgi:HK97 family phage portal protein
MCIRLIARSIAGLPVKVITREIVKGEEIEIFEDSHPINVKIGENGQPNREMSWSDFNQHYWAYAFLDGNNYILATGDLNMPAELWPLRPDRMEVIRGRDQFGLVQVKGYKYTVDGITVLYKPEQILHTKTFDPLSDFQGMALLEPAGAEIDQSNYSALWNVSLLKKGGRPSLLITVDDNKHAPDPQQTQMIKNWAAKNIQGFSNAGDVLIGRGLDIKEVGLKPKDMDWLKGNIQAKVAIANVCGVPPELIGIQDQKTYSNYEEARKAFYEETVIPLADDFFRSLTLFLGSKYKNERRGRMKDVTIAVNKERVQALAESQDGRHKRWRDDFGAGMFTLNETRAEFGFDPVEGGDVILAPANKVPLDLVAGDDSTSEVMPVSEPIEEEENEEN